MSAPKKSVREQAEAAIRARAVELAAQAPDYLTAEQAQSLRRIFTSPAASQESAA